LKTLLLLSVFWLFSSTVYAQTDEQAEKRILATEIIQSIGMLEIYNNAAETVPANYLQSIENALNQNSSHLTSEQKIHALKVFKDTYIATSKRFFAELTATVSVHIQRIYVDNFNLAELREIHKFQLGSLSKRIRDLSIQLTPQLAELVQPRMQDFQAQILEGMKEVEQKLASDGIQLQKK
jgi:hypothetical protein